MTALRAWMSGARAGPASLRSVAAVASAALLVVTACGRDDASPTGEAPIATQASSATTTVAPTTTTPTTTSTTTPTTAPAATSTTSTTPTTTEPAPTTTDPGDACRAYIGELAAVLQATADQLQAGSTVAAQLVDGTLVEADAAAEFSAISETFADLAAGLVGLPEPPEVASPAFLLIAQSLELFESAFELQAEGAATGNGTLIDEGVADLDAGAALLDQVAVELPDCSAPPAPDPGPTELATPTDVDLTVFFRLAESLFDSTDSAYAGTTPEVLTSSAQASCRVLLAGGDIRAAIDAVISASFGAGQPFGSDEQQYVLLVVTRGAALWCPDVIDDQDAFTSEVISTIVDVFFDG